MKLNPLITCVIVPCRPWTLVGLCPSLLSQSSLPLTQLLLFSGMALFFIFFLISLFLTFSQKAEQTKDHLILRNKKIPWSNIDHIRLKRSELGNRFIVIHFRDDIPPDGFDIEWYPNKEELVGFLKSTATEKGFTFTVQEGAWEEPIKKATLPVSKIFSREKEVKEIQVPEISISPRQKTFLKIFLAVAFFAGFWYLFGVMTSAFLFIIVLIHECGHLLALKLFHLETHGIFFIPFIGGGAVSKEEFPSPEIEAAVALAGPVAGLSINGIGYIPLSDEYSVLLLFILLNLGINLINLMPILPLDGGRIFQAALLRGRKSVVPVGIITVGIGAVLSILVRDIILMVVVLLGLATLIHHYKKMEKKEVSPPIWRKSALILAAWIAVIVLYWVTLPPYAKEFLRFLFEISWGL